MVQLNSLVRSSDTSLRIPLSPGLLHHCFSQRHTHFDWMPSAQTAYESLSKYVLQLYRLRKTKLTSILWFELLCVRGKEGLVVLCWQIHVIVSQWFFARHPCVPGEERGMRKEMRGDGNIYTRTHNKKNVHTASGSAQIRVFFFSLAVHIIYLFCFILLFI